MITSAVFAQSVITYWQLNSEKFYLTHRLQDMSLVEFIALPLVEVRLGERLVPLSRHRLAIE